MDKKKWLDKYDISDEDHVHGLEVMAAIGEWQHKKMRPQAEEDAYKNYMREQMLDAAAHHLSGIHAAWASGDKVSAQKHGIFYIAARKALGHDNALIPDPEIENRAKHTPSKVYRFKNHISDSFLLQNKDGK